MRQKHITHLTSSKYREGISQRLFVAKDTFSQKRSKLPIAIISLDGVFGYFDENKAYNLKEKSLYYLLTISHSFRVVAYSQE